MTLQEVKLKLAAEEGFSSLAMWTNHYKKEEAVSLMMDKIARLYAARAKGDLRRSFRSMDCRPRGITPERGYTRGWRI